MDGSMDSNSLLMGPLADEALITSSPSKTKGVPRWKRYASLLVIYFSMIDVMSTYSIVSASLFPYLQSLASGVEDTAFLGIVVAGYSLGRFVMSPLYGFWSNKRPTKEPLIITFLISIVANLLYAYASALPSGGRYLVLVSRIILGGCAGSVAVVRSYIAAATTVDERSLGMAGATSAQLIGMTAGTLVSILFVPLGNNGFSISAIFLHFNMYTGTAYLSALVDIINIILIVALFQEYKIDHKTPDKTQLDKQKGSPVDKIAVVSCIIIVSIIYHLDAVHETILVPYSMDEFAWTRQQAIIYTGLIMAGFTTLSVVVIVVSSVLNRWVELRTMTMVGLVVLAMSVLVLMPMSNEYPQLMSSSDQNNSLAVGCRDSILSWCTKVPKLLIPQYIIGLLVLSIGYSTALVSMLTLYSKILGPYPQGVMMGILTAAGCLSRGIAPLYLSSLYDNTGPQITLAVIIFTVSIAIITLALTYSRMLPYKDTNEAKEITSN